MAFASIAGPIAGAVASKALSSGAAGGKGGAGGGSSESGNLFQQTQNFAPFQADAISSIFDILGGGEGSDLLLGGTGRDSLLQVPPKAAKGVGGALDFATSLLGSDNAPFQDLLNFESGIDLAPRFGDVIDRFETIGNRAEGAFSPFISRALGLADTGADPRFGNLLFETAQRDPASNPFIDALVGDVTTDVTNAVKDQAIAAGGLESSSFGQTTAREAARVSNQIRSAAFESEADRALTAQQAGGQFDLANTAQKINSLIAGSNFLNQRFGVELGAAGGVLSGTQAEESLRLAKRKAIFDSLLARTNLPLAGLGAIGPLANQFTELPFVPLANFAELAFAPLGRTTVGAGSGGSATNPGLFDTAERVAGLGLTGAGILDEAGVFDSGGSSGSSSGSSQAAVNAGTSLIGPSSPFTSPTRFFPGDPFRPSGLSSLFT